MSAPALTRSDVTRPLKSQWPLIFNFFQREVRARYKRSLLGWLWSLINPLSTVVIYTLVFGVFLRTQPPATENGRAEIFSLYLFVGLIVWNVFFGIVNGSMDWMTGVMDLRKKVYFPTETAIFGGALAVLVQSLFEVAVVLALMLALNNISWTFVLYFPLLALMAVFSLGIGLFAAILNARYRDVRYLLGIYLSFQFFLVPIVYPISLLEGDIDSYGLPAAEIVRYNPVSLFVQAGHDLVYSLQLPPIQDVLMMVAYAVVSFTLGLTYFRRRSMEISEEL